MSGQTEDNEGRFFLNLHSMANLTQPKPLYIVTAMYHRTLQESSGQLRIHKPPGYYYHPAPPCHGQGGKKKNKPFVLDNLLYAFRPSRLTLEL
jgi:hypothetical protein